MKTSSTHLSIKFYFQNHISYKVFKQILVGTVLALFGRTSVQQKSDCKLNTLINTCSFSKIIFIHLEFFTINSIDGGVYSYYNYYTILCFTKNSIFSQQTKIII